jgi:hypothetical protein
MSQPAIAHQKPTQEHIRQQPAPFPIPYTIINVPLIQMPQNSAHAETPIQLLPLAIVHSLQHVGHRLLGKLQLQLPFDYIIIVNIF